MDLKQKSARDQYKDNLFGTQVIVLGQLKAVPVGTWWYWVRRRRYWLIHDGTGSVWGSTCWYKVAMDQYKAVMVIHYGTGSV